MASPDPYHEQLRDLAREWRNAEWRHESWQPRAALFHRSTRSMTEYGGQQFDPAHTELLPEGWDHDHCEFCWAKLSNDAHIADFSTGYTLDGRRWLCPPCFDRIVRDNEDPVSVVEGDGDTKGSAARMMQSADSAPDERMLGGFRADLALIILLAVDFLATPAFTCGCGFIAPYVLVLTGGCTIAAWWLWIKAPQRNIVWRVVRMTCVIAITMLLVQNLAHTLWFGHDALLRFPQLLGG